MFKSIKENKFLLGLITALITYQIYFPLIGNKNLTVFIVLAIVLGILSFKREYLKIKGYQIYYYLIFLVFVYVSFLYSADKGDALKYLVYLSLPLPIYFYFKKFSIEKEKILKVFVFSALPYLLFVFFLFIFEKIELKILSAQIMKLFVEPDTLRDLAVNSSSYNIWESKRIGGFFVNAQIGALFAGFNLMAAAWLYFAGKKNIYLGILLLWLVSLPLYGSRTAILASAGTSLLFAAVWMYRKYGFRKILQFAVSIFAIVLLTIAVMSLNPRTRNLGDKPHSLSGRTYIWKSSIGVIKDNWLLGVGLDGNTWTEKYNIYAEKLQARQDTPPHNIFLEMWGKSGLFAAFFLVLFFASTILQNTKLFIKTGIYYYALVFSILCFTIFYAFLENMFLMDPRILGLFWMILGLNSEKGNGQNEKV